VSAPQRALLVAARELFAERAHPDGLAAALTFTGLVVLLESLAFGPGRAAGSTGSRSCSHRRS